MLWIHPFGIGISFGVKGGFWEVQANIRFLEDIYSCLVLWSKVARMKNDDPSVKRNKESWVYKTPTVALHRFSWFFDVVGRLRKDNLFWPKHRRLEKAWETGRTGSLVALNYWTPNMVHAEEETLQKEGSKRYEASQRGVKRHFRQPDPGNWRTNTLSDSPKTSLFSRNHHLSTHQTHLARL